MNVKHMIITLQIKLHSFQITLSNTKRLKFISKYNLNKIFYFN